jgi:hypothetical protein
MTARRGQRLAAIVLLTAAGVAADAWGLGLCSKRTGALVVRETCRRHEARLDLLLVGTPGPTGQPGAPGAAGPMGPGVVLLDAVGRRVGVSVLLSEGELLAAVLGGRLVGLVVTTAGVPQRVRFLHERADCADSPLAAADQVLPLASVVGTTAYVPKEPIVMHTVNATEADFPNCAALGGTLLPNGRCCRPSTANVLAGPITPVDLTELEYTPPLHLAYE